MILTVQRRSALVKELSLLSAESLLTIVKTAAANAATTLSTWNPHDHASSVAYNMLYVKCDELLTDLDTVKGGVRMNAYHHKMYDVVYPFLEQEWNETGAVYSDYLEYDEIVLELVRDVRKRTTPGSSRLVQMVCLYEYEPLARAIAHFVETPDWPIEYQLNRVREEHGREVSE